MWARPLNGPHWSRSAWGSLEGAHLLGASPLTEGHVLRPFQVRGVCRAQRGCFHTCSTHRGLVLPEAAGHPASCLHAESFRSSELGSPPWSPFLCGPSGHPRTAIAAGPHARSGAAGREGGGAQLRLRQLTTPPEACCSWSLGSWCQRALCAGLGRGRSASCCTGLAVLRGALGTSPAAGMDRARPSAPRTVSSLGPWDPVG